MQQARLVLDCQNHHGEGVFWNPVDQRVWWTDIHGQIIWAFDPVSQVSQSFAMPSAVCCFAPRQHGGLIVAFADRVSFYDLDTGVEQLICEFEPHNPETRLNDGRVDRQGNFVVGGMNEVSGKADSSVIRVSQDGTVCTLIEDVACANSICFSVDGKQMFFTDSPDRQIQVYDYDPQAKSLAAPRLHADFKHMSGLPDGSCIDSEGGVWNAVWEGNCVVRIGPDGNIDQIIDVPVWKPTCCAFGGAELDTLYITTSCLMSSSERIAREPGSGGLFAFKPAVRGKTDQPFAG